MKKLVIFYFILICIVPFTSYSQQISTNKIMKCQKDFQVLIDETLYNICIPSKDSVKYSYVVFKHPLFKIDEIWNQNIADSINYYVNKFGLTNESNKEFKKLNIIKDYKKLAINNTVWYCNNGNILILTYSLDKSNKVIVLKHVKVIYEAISTNY